MQILFILLVSVLFMFFWAASYGIVLMETGRKHTLLKFFLAPVWVWKIIFQIAVIPLLRPLP